ncbi:hypothetical protein GJV44_00768 [Candidatus Vallotia cooleyia]|nr:hypothetical protein GJV44_00768 [Candidatus Vallotia cooleyia]
MRLNSDEMYSRQNIVNSVLPELFDLSQEQDYINRLINIVGQRKTPDRLEGTISTPPGLQSDLVEDIAESLYH